MPIHIEDDNENEEVAINLVNNIIVKEEEKHKWDNIYFYILCYFSEKKYFFLKFSWRWKFFLFYLVNSL